MPSARVQTDQRDAGSALEVRITVASPDMQYGDRRRNRECRQRRPEGLGFPAFAQRPFQSGTQAILVPAWRRARYKRKSPNRSRLHSASKTRVNALMAGTRLASASSARDAFDLGPD